MRKLMVLGLLALAGCNGEGGTVNAAAGRSICESAGGSAGQFDQAVQLAEEDKASGLSAAESMELFMGDCTDDCPAGDAACLETCTTCTDAAVILVYHEL